MEGIMKIYRKIIFDFDFNVIEEDSYDYDGELAKCDGGGDSGGDRDEGSDPSTSPSPGPSGADAAAQGMADAQANSQTSFGNTGVSQDPSGMAGMFGIDASTGSGMSEAAAQAVASAADKAVSTNTFDWSAFTKSVAKGMIAGFPAGMPGVTYGALFGAVKGAIDQFGTISKGVTSGLSGISTATSTSATTDSVSMGGTPPDYVWDGNNFVSPTSPTGQQAIAKVSGTTGGAATSNLSLEDQLKKEQLEILRQQRSESDALNKLIYQAAGIIKDQTTGEWRKATETERRSFMTDTESKEYDLYLQQLERQRKALAGELPVSPALERELSDWDAEQKEALTRRLGTGYMTSTPGIQSMERQNERTGLLREEARRGEISAGSSRVLDWRNALNNQNVQTLNTYGAMPMRTSGLLTGYQGALVPYTQQSSINAANDRQAAILADQAYWNRQNQKAQQNQSKWSTIGTIGGYLFS